MWGRGLDQAILITICSVRSELQKHWLEIYDHNVYSVSFSYGDQQGGQEEPCTSSEDDASNSAYPEEDRSSPTVTRGQKRKISLEPADSAKSWKTEKDPDFCPVANRFIPARPPGHQLNSNNRHTPLDLFKLFFSNDAILTLCQNTNKQAAENIAKGKKYSWTDLDIPEFLNYIGLTFFFSLVKLDNICDYWKKNTIFSVPFPADVMPQDRYRAISWNIHMSDPDKDVENDRQKGTPQYDHLSQLKPLMDTIKHACKMFYHPRQNLLIDERTLVRKNHTGSIQKMAANPKKCGFKLFVLSDCSGYILDFAVYTGKSQFESGTGLAYDSVMRLVKSAYLGSGYNLFLDHFYTSPKLFKDLLSLNIGACGTYRDNRRGCPTTQSNALKTKDHKGTLRWIREDSVVFVKWKDSREVSICSTVHQAFSGYTVERRGKNENGKPTVRSIPCPTPVMEYNKYMGGTEDLLGQLTQYYSVHHKTSYWYRLLFLHFLDIAATNSFLLHKELCKEKHEEPMTHRAFLEELTAQLCGVTVAVPPTKGSSGHLPVPISNQPDSCNRVSYGRRTCVQCRLKKKEYQSTPWMCKECDVALCLVADRNCFEAWHN